MAKMADVRKRGRSWLTGAALIAVGVLAGQAVPHSIASPRTETGMVTLVSPMSGTSGARFWFKPRGGTRQSYRFDVPTPWQATPAGAWHDSGRPSCLVPRSAKPRRITLGVVSVQPVGTAPGRQLVVWVQCAG